MINENEKNTKCIRGKKKINKIMQVSLFLSIFLTSFLLISQNNQDNENQIPGENLMISTPKMAVSHESILIDGANATNDWDDHPTAISSGFGTLLEPYIITNLDIDGNNAETCIEIRNSTAYFNIEYNNLTNSGNIWNEENPLAGIKLINVTNFKINNNNIFGCNETGIYIRQSSNGSIIDNQIVNNIHWAFSAKNISQVEITQNNITYNQYGFKLSDSVNNSITYNNISDNEHSGLFFEDSFFNNVTNNSFSNNEWDGITLRNSGNNRFENNNFWKEGFYFESNSVNNLIDTSNLVNGKPIYYYENDIQIIFDGKENSVGQFILINCTNSILKNLKISNIGNGVQLLECNNISIIDCNISDILGVGIMIDNTHNSHFIRNILRNNDIVGIWGDGDNNTYLENTITTPHNGDYADFSLCIYGDNNLAYGNIIAGQQWVVGISGDFNQIYSNFVLNIESNISLGIIHDDGSNSWIFENIVNPELDTDEDGVNNYNEVISYHTHPGRWNPEIDFNDGVMLITDGIWQNIESGLYQVSCIDEDQTLWMMGLVKSSKVGDIKLTHFESNPSSYQELSYMNSSMFYKIELSENSEVEEPFEMDFYFPNGFYSEAEKEYLALYKLDEDEENWIQISSILDKNANKLKGMNLEANKLYAIGYKLNTSDINTEENIPGFPLLNLILQSSICFALITTYILKKKKEI